MEDRTTATKFGRAVSQDTSNHVQLLGVGATFLRQERAPRLLAEQIVNPIKLWTSGPLLRLLVNAERQGVQWSRGIGFVPCFQHTLPAVHCGPGSGTVTGTVTGTAMLQ